MINVLKSFTSDSIFNATSRLLEELKIQFSTETREPIHIQDFYDGPLPQYLIDAFKCVEASYYIGILDDASLSGKESDIKLRNRARYDAMFVFACEIKADASLTRTVAAALTRGFNRIASASPVVLVMCQADKLTLATCERTDSAHGGEKLGKVSVLRNVDCTNPHAGHRQILEGVAKDVTGSQSYDVLYEKWLKSFSIDVLSDKFFNEYKSIYEDIIEYVTGKRMVKEGNRWVERIKGEPCADIMGEFSHFSDPEKTVRDYVKKLMGRLVFIQFLQKKGWMGVPIGDSWENGDSEFLQHLFDNSEKKETFVDDVLEPLFNDLNTKRHGDLVTNQNLGANIKVPYLNGGLFELDENDDAKFPLPSHFIKNLLDFFASYNFTIDENAPNDVEIGVDPEMLGRIFENLLEDNKEKGAFYTPKEIVHYMCHESLIAYLTTCVIKKQGEKHQPEEKIRSAIIQLLDQPEVVTHRMTEEQLNDFGHYIRNVKICDPAIGSGAFPMGLLNELVQCRSIIGAWAKDEYGNLLVNDYAALKAEIICNNIYGVDIEKGAIDIARLRFWLSIIVDLKMPHALPNFDYKFMQGNSLITTFNGEHINLDTKNQQHIKVNEMIAEKKRLYALKQQHYGSQGNRKHELAVEIKKSILRLISMQLGYELRSWYEKNVISQASLNFMSKDDNLPFEVIKRQLPQDKQNLVNLAQSLYKKLNDNNIDVANRAMIDINFFDWKIMFTEVFDAEDGNGGFDIVIGNPPYVNIANIQSSVERKYYQKKFETVKNKCDLYSIFTEQAYSLLRKKGICNFIFSNSWMGTDSFSLFRHFLIENTQIKKLVDIPFDVFKDATVKTCIILFCKNAVDVNTILLENYDGVQFNQLNKALSYDDIKRYSHFPFSLDVRNEQAIDLYKISHVQLKDIATFTLGIKTSNDKKFISAEKFKEDSYRLIRGRNFKRYSKPVSEEWIWYRPDLFKEKVGSGPRKLDYFIVPQKILIQDVAKEICATIDTDKYLCNDTINVIYKLNEDFSFKYILGILNSKAVRYWHKQIFPKGLHVKKYQLEIIPIPIVIQNIQNIIGELVSKIIDLKDDNECSYNSLEQEIDHIVYHLYDLSYDEVLVVDPETPITREEYESFKLEDCDK